ncbi:MAG: PAS domain-containing protein, partial [Rhodoferax sp.]
MTAFAASMAVVAGLVCATWLMAASAKEAATMVAQTYDVLDRLSETRAETLQIEFSTQAFRVSGNPARLVERYAAIATRERLLEQIRVLISDNVQQHDRWTRLRAVIDERLAISRQVELLRKTQGQEAASAYVATVPLEATRNLSKRLVSEMEQQERQLLALRIADHTQAREVVVYSGVAVSLLLLAALSISFFLIRRQIREAKASRHALVQSEESLATTLYSIGDAVLATDSEGRVTRMNPVAERLTGWSMAQAMGQPVATVFEIVNEYTREPTEVPVDKALQTGQVQELANHTILIARDGSELPISDSAAPIRDAAGLVRGVVLVFRDVSTAHRMQQMVRDQNHLLEQRVQERTSQLVESETHLRSVINNVPALIAYVDASQRYVYVNKQYAERFAPDHSDIRGCRVQDILGESRFTVAAPLISQVLAGHAQHYDWEPFPGVWQAINYIPKWDGNAHVVGYYVMGSDITQRKNSEQRIQALNTDLEANVRNLERTSRILRTLSAGNRTMLRATDELELLQRMCSTIVEIGGYAVAAVWYRTEDAAQSLRPMAGVGYTEGLSALNKVKTTWADTQNGQGVVARAIRSGQTQFVRDVRTDPNYAVWRDHLGGVASGFACPLRVGDQTIGALAIYASDPHAIAPDEEALLSEMADDLAFGITTLRARHQRAEFQAAMHRLTRFDLLTGLPNETHFTDFLIAAISTGQQLDEPFSVLQTNVGRLNEINDAMGFSRGD